MFDNGQMVTLGEKGVQRYMYHQKSVRNKLKYILWTKVLASATEESSGMFQTHDENIGLELAVVVLEEIPQYIADLWSFYL